MRALLLTIFTFSYCFAVNHRVIYSAAYGQDSGMVLYENPGYIDECSAIPGSFFINNRNLYLQDQNNNRVQKISLRGGNVMDILPNVYLRYVRPEESYIVGYRSIQRIQSDRVFTVFECREKRESFEYHVIHPSGFLIIQSNRNRYYFDTTLTSIRREMLPESIVVEDAIIFLDKKAVIGFSLNAVRNALTKWSHEFGWEVDRLQPTTLFPFPDSSEWGPYFTHRRESVSMKYLGYDKHYNTYWSTGRTEREDTANSYVGFFCYDRFGEIRYWFPEPVLSSGWKHYCGDILISEDGRVFQMIFRSHSEDSKKYRKKPEGDLEMGIRILEYIPEKKDFTHEGRVELYGKAK